MSPLARRAALLVLALTACASPPEPEPEPVRAMPPASTTVEAGFAGPDVALGREIATRVCSRCHALEGEGPSPHPAAPAFPLLARRLPGDVLLPRLEEGIRANHPAMPEIRLAPSEIDSFLAFWSTL